MILLKLYTFSFTNNSLNYISPFAIGMTIISFDFSTVRYTFSILMLFGVAIARLFAVFVPPALAYIFCRKEIALTLKEMKIIWYSGLVRGKQNVFCFNKMYTVIN